MPRQGGRVDAQGRVADDQRRVGDAQHRVEIRGMGNASAARRRSGARRITRTSSTLVRELESSARVRICAAGREEISRMLRTAP